MGNIFRTKTTTTSRTESLPSSGQAVPSDTAIAETPKAENSGAETPKVDTPDSETQGAESSGENDEVGHATVFTTGPGQAHQVLNTRNTGSEGDNTRAFRAQASSCSTTSTNTTSSIRIGTVGSDVTIISRVGSESQCNIEVEAVKGRVVAIQARREDSTIAILETLYPQSPSHNNDPSTAEQPTLQAEQPVPCSEDHTSRGDSSFACFQLNYCNVQPPPSNAAVQDNNIGTVYNNTDICNSG